MKKHCEWCGKESENAYYRFIGESENMFLLKSPLISRFDIQQSKITLRNGLEFPVTGQVSAEVAVSIADFVPHLFCTEGCEYAFMKAHELIFRDDMPQKTPMIQTRKEGLYCPLVVEVEKLKHDIATCDTCGHTFPNISKWFSSSRIMETAIAEGTLSLRPTGVIARYALAFSDITSDHPSGHWYLMNIDSEHSRKVMFCSNECAYDYACENSSLIMFKNNILQGNLVCINPFTLRLNSVLHKVSPYEPQVIQRSSGSTGN